MVDPWQILRDGGLPLVVETRGTRPEARELAAATRAAVAQKPDGRAAEALAAFVFAWQQHWPACFAQSFGEDQEQLVAWASRHAIDDNRYLKLRRIALENLSHIL